MYYNKYYDPRQPLLVVIDMAGKCCICIEALYPEQDLYSGKQFLSKWVEKMEKG